MLPKEFYTSRAQEKRARDVGKSWSHALAAVVIGSALLVAVVFRQGWCMLKLLFGRLGELWN